LELPERAWTLIVEIIERAPSDAALGFLAASPLEDLLSKDGPDFIERVEQRALGNAKFRRALGMLKRLRMTEDVWHGAACRAARAAT
jgi:hypothetical protein